jgi:hypothetical protein
MSQERDVKPPTVRISPMPDPDRVEFAVVVDDALSPGGLVKFGVPLGILETLRLFVRAPMPATVDHMTRYLWLTLPAALPILRRARHPDRLRFEWRARQQCLYKDALRLDSIHRFGN